MTSEREVVELRKHFFVAKDILGVVEISLSLAELEPGEILKCLADVLVLTLQCFSLSFVRLFGSLLLGIITEFLAVGNGLLFFLLFLLSI
mmetsp:Transcript_801/g.1202  ORF Transcript_801/g.1202 Transcript_801/m.1202 type:complete len:90 (+) Transcript_801:75-344(+)